MVCRRWYWSLWHGQCTTSLASFLPPSTGALAVMLSIHTYGSVYFDLAVHLPARPPAR